jgi:isopentenyl diphosphate isomerase/L-lactate dehydrogenase-like FMN-dependent dehydrogenase
LIGPDHSDCNQPNSQLSTPWQSLTLTEQALDLDQSSGWMTRFRLGQDVMRALALGARFSMIGRAYAFGLGAGGEAGVAKALDILGKEMLTIVVRRQHGC